MLGSLIEPKTTKISKPFMERNRAKLHAVQIDNAETIFVTDNCYQCIALRIVEMKNTILMHFFVRETNPLSKYFILCPFRKCQHLTQCIIEVKMNRGVVAFGQ